MTFHPYNLGITAPGAFRRWKDRKRPVFYKTTALAVMPAEAAEGLVVTDIMIATEQVAHLINITKLAVDDVATVPVQRGCG